MSATARRLAITAVAACLLSALAGARAQLPGVGRVGAGTRLTFYSSAASVTGSSKQAVWKPNCDPTVEDCWTDPATGRSIGQEDVPSASGQGYTQVDILYLGADACAMRITSYTLDPTTGAVLTAAPGGAVTAGGACFDYWQDSAALAALQDQPAAGRRVLKGPYKIGDLSFQAVSVSSSAAGAAMSSTYDAVTGLLVVSSSRTQGAAVPTITGNTLTAGAGNTQLTYSQLLNVRDVPGMAIQEALPANVAGVSRLVYGCAQTTTVSGAGTVSVPCSFEVGVTRRTQLWLEAQTDFQAGSGVAGVATSSQGTLLIVSGSYGGLFASPAWLASLSMGQVIDTDPVTGVQASVGQADGSYVGILEQSNAETKQYYYDRSSGWLVRFIQSQSMGLGSTTVQYDLSSVQ